jgi:hypothetical protein
MGIVKMQATQIVGRTTRKADMASKPNAEYDDNDVDIENDGPADDEEYVPTNRCDADSLEEDDHHEEESRTGHAQLNSCYSDTPVFNVSSGTLTRSAPENSELYDWYRLVQALLQNSIFEMRRGTGARLEPEFWRSRYADFFIDQFNCMRELMGMTTVTARTLRIGIARKFDQPDDWLLPDDNLSEDEIDVVCGQYAKMWRRIHRDNPEGVDDASSNYLFTPNITPTPTRAEEAKASLQDPPKPRQESEPSIAQALFQIKPLRAANNTLSSAQSAHKNAQMHRE